MKEFFRWKGYDVAEFESLNGKVIVNKRENADDEEVDYRMKTNFRVIETKRIVDGKYLIRR